MMNRGRITLMGLAAVIALAPAVTAAPAASQIEVNETRAASPDMTLEFDDLIVGSLKITGWDRNELRVTGTIGNDVEDFDIEGGPDNFVIVAEWDDHDWDHDWDGDMEDGTERDRDRRRHRSSDDVDIDLEISVPFGASLELSTVTANVEIRGVSGEIEVETVTGNIDYEGEAAMLDLEAVTGNLDIRTTTLREGDFATVQGSIEFAGGLAPGADAAFESVMGGITLRLPADTSADFDVETMMGDIDNELGPEAVATDRWVPSKELHFSIGGGSADVSIETLQGRIRILRQ